MYIFIITQALFLNSIINYYIVYQSLKVQQFA